MEITRLKTQVSNPNRVNVFVDGKFFRGLNTLVAMKLGLKVGLVLNPYLVKQLDQQVTGDDAWEYALRLLQHSPKSVRQLETKLRSKFDTQTVHKTTTKLISQRIVDDTRLAGDLVGRAMAEKTKSRRQIFVWLKTKLFDDATINQALKLIDDDYDRQAAWQVGSKKYGQLLRQGKVGDINKKLSAYLAQRGFGYNAVKAVLSDIQQLA
ncbi:MAG: regulatory protein RecX [Patescibacteria group bacterium]|nr:regulatory protein RecX [Patescibacteria group bacterium]